MRRAFALSLLVSALALALSGVAAANNGNGNGNGNGNPHRTSGSSGSSTSSGSSGTSVNNGGGTPSCGNSCDSSHNPTDFHKSCRPVPGNGCHVLPDTPCERGHGGTEVHNKHCRPELKLLKEQKLDGQPDSSFTASQITAPLNSSQIDYRITLENFTSSTYSVVASDPNCTIQDPLVAAVPNLGALTPGQSIMLSPLSIIVYTCFVDVIPGTGEPGLPDSQVPVGSGPYTFVNTMSVTATSASGSARHLTSSVTATVPVNS